MAPHRLHSDAAMYSPANRRRTGAAVRRLTEDTTPRGFTAVRGRFTRSRSDAPTSAREAGRQRRCSIPRDVQQRLSSLVRLPNLEPAIPIPVDICDKPPTPDCGQSPDSTATLLWPRSKG